MIEVGKVGEVGCFDGHSETVTDRSRNDSFPRAAGTYPPYPPYPPRLLEPPSPDPEPPPMPDPPPAREAAGIDPGRMLPKLSRTGA